MGLEEFLAGLEKNKEKKEEKNDGGDSSNSSNNSGLDSRPPGFRKKVRDSARESKKNDGGGSKTLAETVGSITRRRENPTGNDDDPSDPGGTSEETGTPNSSISRRRPDPTGNDDKKSSSPTRRKIQEEAEKQNGSSNSSNSSTSSSSSSGGNKKNKKNKKKKKKGLGDKVAEFTGVKEWQQSQTASDLRGVWNKRRGDKSLDADGARLDASVRAGMDFLLDNPKASVQDTARGTVEYATGSDDLGSDAQNVATNVTNAVDEEVNAKVGGTAAETAIDGGAWLFDAMVADPTKAGVKATTGVDIDSGSNEGTVGTTEVADLALTAATAGTGTVAAKTLRGASKSDEAGGVISRTLGRGRNSGKTDPLPDSPSQQPTTLDDVVQPQSTRNQMQDVVDDMTERVNAARNSADDVAETVTRGADEAAETAGSTVTRTARGAQDAGEGLLSRVRNRANGRKSDEEWIRGTRGSDDVAETAARRGGDDVAENAARRGTGAAGKAATRGADDAGESLISRVTGGNGRKVGGAAVVGAGGLAALSQIDTEKTIETEDGQTLSHTKSYSATERIPSGGDLYEVTEDGESAGYWLLLGRKGRNLVVLNADGSTRTAKITPEELQRLVGGGN